MDPEIGQRCNPGAKMVHMAMEQDRRKFAIKVYSIVGVQIAGTAVIAWPIATASQLWLESHSYLMMFSFLSVIGMTVALACSGRRLMRKHPVNLILLAGFTAIEGVTVGFFCSMYETQSVIFVLLAVSIAAIALTYWAATTKMDFTSRGGVLVSASMALFGIGMLGLIFRNALLEMLYAYCGAALFAGYLVHDTQLILTGEHKSKKFDLDDYALAALSIYMDLVRLFIHLLRIAGKRKDGRGGR